MKLKTMLRYSLLCMLITCYSLTSNAERRIGNVTLRTMTLQDNSVTFERISLFEKTPVQQNDDALSALKQYTLLNISKQAEGVILNAKPEYIRISVPYTNGNLELLLYRVDISPNGFTLKTSDGNAHGEPNTIIHYRGMISGDPYSVVSFSVTENEIIGMICNDEGNYVVGKMSGSNGGAHVIYNDKNLIPVLNYECGTNTSKLVSPLGEELLKIPPPNSQSVNCVNWYYETDYDVFVNKGSVANVNTFIQGIFNNVATLYDNDGISIALQTVFVWNTTDPYTGPSTSNYLSQFGQYRTSFAGDLANLVGFSGGGGIAYVNGLCASSSSVRMGYSGINASYSNVPTYSWTVEVITHEDGHLTGSRHTHDCVWNGNSTRIDNCGPQAGYNSGSCAAGPMPSSGTIMSYCHLVSGVGINFNNGFGPQPSALMLNNVNNASCLQACSPCPAPPQPGNISGSTSFCGVNSLTYSITAVAGATSYIWTIPSGWTGTSSTNSITVNTTSSGGAIGVVAVNSCGNSVARMLTVSGNAAPGQVGNLVGPTTACQGTLQTYSIQPVSGATSYTWTLPSGWSGNSSANNIIATTGTTGGTVSVIATNSCGSSSPRTVTVTINNTPAQPSSITPSGGSSKVCPGNTRTYTIGAVSGATSYLWTPPTGGVITSGQGSASINVEYNSAFTTSGTIRVSAVNSCGPGIERTKQIARNNPARPSVITGPASGVCNSTSNYSVASTNGVIYNWSFTQTGVSVVSGQGTSSIDATFTNNAPANKVIVNASNACGTSANRNLNISSIPLKPATISGTSTPCANQQGVPYSIAPVAGATSYTWMAPSGSRINDGSTTSTSATMTTTASNVTVNFKNTSGYVRVKANNSCGSSANQSMAINFSCREASSGLENGQAELILFPSVTSDYLNLLITDDFTGSIVSVVDPAGKTVMKIVMTGKELELDVTSLAPGIYSVVTNTGTKILSGRFIRQ